MQLDTLIAADRAHVWHPYSAVNHSTPLFAVESANGVHLHLKSGESLIDGMSSWWSVLHGYNHPELNRAVTEQLEKMAHVMFGGLTHEPAVLLAKRLVDITPDNLTRVFFSDSGSVAVEVAMKMALQYWQPRNKQKTRFLTITRGYHGDTFGAMSVCDPDTGMHSLFRDVLPKHIFAPRPERTFGEPCTPEDFENFRSVFLAHKDSIAAIILEPIVQGTGGMHFYSAMFLKNVRSLCDEFDVLLIADEIATGLGRTGKLFACEHADIQPDIMCLGKTLSAGYITLAATLCTNDIAQTICQGDPGIFMHGPTYMANPLACAVALKSLDLLEKNVWEQQVSTLNTNLLSGLKPCLALDSVANVRVLGGIGVVEMKEIVDLNRLQPEFVRQGIWLRPFGKMIYTLPPFVSSADNIQTLCRGIFTSILNIYKH